jgi:hypothetical protein
VSNSLIDHNATNNCTDNSYSLFNSSHNTVSNNTADYPFTMNFIVTAGSSYNLLTGNVASTGDFFGYLVADPLPGAATLATYGPSHDNALVGNVSHTDGPTGAEKKAGVVPAFLGGFVVLNGTYNNQILNNQGLGFDRKRLRLGAGRTKFWNTDRGKHLSPSDPLQRHGIGRRRRHREPEWQLLAGKHFPKDRYLHTATVG